ncbi:MAG TPA: SDR family oxidoreductase [bacterium]|jgi:pteridine reductase|nr:SDR family oxidoreductase [bacterium]
MELKGKRALVTGGAVRIGRHIALALAGKGCHILLHYGHSQAEAEATAKEIRALGVECRLHAADLADAGAVLALGHAALRPRFRCQILVNCAAIFPRVPLAKATAQDFDRPYAVNLRAPALLTQVLGTAWQKSRLAGRIINIADVGGRLAWPGALPYSLSKAGLLQLTRASAAALAPQVLVNSVSPGPMLMPDRHSAAQKKASLKRSLVGRLGGPEEIARAVLFIAQSDFMTGSDLVVDGGRQLAG